jgi:hypothetical protein
MLKDFVVFFQDCMKFFLTSKRQTEKVRTQNTVYTKHLAKNKKKKVSWKNMNEKKQGKTVKWNLFVFIQNIFFYRK